MGISCAVGTVCFLTGSIGIGMAMDTKGNMGIQATLAGGVTTGIPTEGAIKGMSMVFGGFTSISNAPDIYALEGEGTNIGGSAFIPAMLAALGLDLNFLGNVNENPYDGYYGLTMSVVRDTGYELHVTEGCTYPVFQYVNVFDIWDRIYNVYTDKRCEI